MQELPDVDDRPNFQHLYISYEGMGKGPDL